MRSTQHHHAPKMPELTREEAMMLAISDVLAGPETGREKVHALMAIFREELVRARVEMVKSLEMEGEL